MYYLSQYFYIHIINAQISKSNVIDDVVQSNKILYKPGEKPDHCIVIKYVPYVGKFSFFIFYYFISNVSDSQMCQEHAYQKYVTYYVDRILAAAKHGLPF